MLVRKDHWATRSYNDFLIETANRPFVWGQNDCALMCANGIHAFTGVDIAEDFRTGYANEEEAFALIASVTGVTNGTVEDAAAYCANKFELPEWQFPLQAQRGDLVVIEDSGCLIAGLVHLNGRHIISVGEAGLKRLSILDVKRAWHV